jgi:hypothetical protein
MEENREYENDKQKLNYLFYIERDMDKSWELFLQIFNYSLKDKHTGKHRCDRNSECECVELFPIFLENLLLQYKQALPETRSKETVLNMVEKYFNNPGIYLPFKSLLYLVRIKLQVFEILEARNLLENYLIYSEIIINQNNNNQTRGKFPLSFQEYETLTEVLIFEVILRQGGFSMSKSKISSLHESIQNKFIEMLNKKYAEYKEGEIPDYKREADDYSVNKNYQLNKESQTLHEKIMAIINKTIYLGRENLSNRYSNFSPKTFLNKFCSIITNKAVILVLYFIFGMILLKKLNRKFHFDKKLIFLFTMIFNFLDKKLPLFNTMKIFVTSIFNLLINY